MAPQDPDRAPLTNALLKLLRDQTGRPVGDLHPPRKANEEVEDPPYSVLYPLPGGGLIGPPLSDQRHSDGTWVYQVTCVGKNRAQA